MKRIMIFMAAMTISVFMVASSHAQTSGDTVAQGDPGDVVVIEISLTGADDMEFKTSPQVEMSWVSDADGFAVNAAHAAAYEAPGGQAYGMAGDTNKVFWQSIEGMTEIVEVTTPDSSEFETDYQPMK